MNATSDGLGPENDTPRGARGAWLAALILTVAMLFFIAALGYRSAGDGSTAATPQYPTAGRMPDDFDRDDSPQAVAFRVTCSQCHVLPSPYVHDQAGWRGVAGKMQNQMKERGIQIPRKQIDLAIEYVIRHARPGRIPTSRASSQVSRQRFSD